MNDRKTIVSKMRDLAEEAREISPHLSCILFSLCGAMLIGREGEMVEPVTQVTVQHLAICQDEMVLNADVLTEGK